MSGGCPKPSAQQRAKLRCCASCEWVYKGPGDCPQCGFASYGARYVFGDKAYRYQYTQEPWKRRALIQRESELLRIIRAANAVNGYHGRKKRRHIFEEDYW